MSLHLSEDEQMVNGRYVLREKCDCAPCCCSQEPSRRSSPPVPTGVEAVAPLLASEEDDLDRHERTIEAGLRTFNEVGQALLAIREGRLYRQVCSTFEEYCETRWGLGRRHAYRMIDAASVVDNLQAGEVCPMGHILPTSERQARPLTGLDPDQQREAWAEAVATAPNGTVTAAHVAQVVEDKFRPKPIKDPENYCDECGSALEMDNPDDLCPTRCPNCDAPPEGPGADPAESERKAREAADWLRQQRERIERCCERDRKKEGREPTLFPTASIKLTLYTGKFGQREWLVDMARWPEDSAERTKLRGHIDTIMADIEVMVGREFDPGFVPGACYDLKDGER